MSEPVYLDHNGTTPIDPHVLDAMMPYFSASFGNPSSATPLGQQARAATEKARCQVADLIGAEASEIVFTGGGTEASNHAILGFSALAPLTRRTVVTSTVEHPATEMPCRKLAASGFEVLRIPVTHDGVVRLDKASAAISQSTALVTVIHAQNETGTLQPVAELAKAALNAGAPIHVDASQSLGKVPVNVRGWNIDAMTIAGHKLYAPKGVGALFVRSGHEIASVMSGAGQEHGRRPGTENVPYIVGLGRACVIAGQSLAEEAVRLTGLRERLWQQLYESVPGIERVGAGAPTLPNTLNVLFPCVSGNALLSATPEVWASTGSACHAGQNSPSSIILALGYNPEQAIGAVRLTLGRATTALDIERAVKAIVVSWQKLQQGSGRTTLAS